MTVRGRNGWGGADLLQYVLLLVPPAFIYVLYRTTEIADLALRKKVICLSIASASVPFIVGLLWRPFISFIPDYNQYFFNLFWGSGLKFVVITLFTLSGLLYFAFIKKNSTYSLYFLILMFELYVLSFHWDRYVRPRYGFYVLPFFIMILSAGIYALYRVIISTGMKNWMKYLNVILLVCLVLTIFNVPLDAVTAVTWDKHGYVPWSNEFHDRLSGLSMEYGDIIDKDDVIISSLIGAIRLVFNMPLDKKIYPYSYSSELRFDDTASIVESYDRGWIILDQRRNNHWTRGFPSHNFTINETWITFHGRADGWYIYSWERD